MINLIQMGSWSIAKQQIFATIVYASVSLISLKWVLLVGRMKPCSMPKDVCELCTPEARPPYGVVDVVDEWAGRWIPR